MGPFETDTFLTQIYNLLYRLGVRANVCGFRYASCAIFLSMKEPERLRFLSRELYPEIARLYRVEPDDVRDGIRRVIVLIWKKNPRYLQQLAGQPLHTCPTPRQFILFTSQYLKKSVPPAASAESGTAFI